MEKNPNIIHALISGNLKKTDSGLFLLMCHQCKEFRKIKSRDHIIRAIKQKHKCDSCAQRLSKTGKKLSLNHKTSQSISQKKRYLKSEERIKTSVVVKKAIHIPEIRQKHLDALHHSKWIKVRTDKGQIELLEKWNRLGFSFEPNVQLRTTKGLFYIDGYDKKRNVVLEYDGKYHSKISQKTKDIMRQNEIIDFLNPNVFWRFNSVIGKCYDIYRKDRQHI
jgi:very-short-patch-repair endonuclease